MRLSTGTRFALATRAAAQTVVGALFGVLAFNAMAADPPVYRGVDAHGVVSYSSVPQAGSKLINTQRLGNGASAGFDGPPPAKAIAAAVAANANNAKGDQPASEATPDRWAAIAQAQKALSAAQQAQKLGVEPEAGERTGTAHGGTRLNDDYAKRQKALADNVAAAQSALGAAQSLP